MTTLALLSAAWIISTAAATAAFIVANRNRDGAIVWAMFIFASVSYYHTFFFSISTLDMREWLVAMGGNPLHKIAVALVLATVLGSAVVRLPTLDLSGKWPELSMTAVALLLGVIGYATRFSPDTSQWLIDAGSHLAFVALLMGLLALSPRNRPIVVPTVLMIVVGVLVVLSVTVSVYEIATGRAWATYTRADGLIVVRASGLMFNPNLLGGWLGLAFLMLSRAPVPISRSGILLFRALIALIGAGLFLSGSRGAVICLLVSAITAIAANWRRARNVVQQYGLVGLPFAIVLVGSLLAHGTTFNTLALRWLDVPLGIAHAVLPRGASDTVAETVGETAGVDADVLMLDGADSGFGPESRNLEIAVTGRFSGDLRDNGFLAALDQGGPAALVGLVVLWIAVFAVAIRASRQGQGDVRAGMWGLLAYLVIWSMQVRAFQVYPIWVFMAIGIALVLRDATSSQSGHALLHRARVVEAA